MLHYAFDSAVKDAKIEDSEIDVRYCAYAQGHWRVGDQRELN